MWTRMAFATLALAALVRADWTAPVVAGTWTSLCMTATIDTYYLGVVYRDTFTVDSSGVTGQLSSQVELQLGGCGSRVDVRSIFMGTFNLTEPDDSNSTAAQQDAFMQISYFSKPLYLLSQNALVLLQLVCPDLYKAAGSPASADPNTPIETLITGCTTLGIGTCPSEYDRVRTFENDQLLAKGLRFDGSDSPLIPCSAETRPSTYGPTEYRHLPTPTPTPTAAKTPTSTPSSTHSPSHAAVLSLSPILSCVLAALLAIVLYL